jgi:hypothetical protein
MPILLKERIKENYANFSAVTLESKRGGRERKIFSTIFTSKNISPRPWMELTISLKLPKGFIFLHLNNLKVRSQHLKLGFLHTLGTFVGLSKNVPSFLGGLTVSDATKFIWRNTIENNTNATIVLVTIDNINLTPFINVTIGT